MLARNHPNGNVEPNEHGKALAQVIVPAAGTVCLRMFDRQIEVPQESCGLCICAHILERRHGKRVDRMPLYWTSESSKGDALMALPHRSEQVDEAGRRFDATVGSIRTGDCSVTTPPEATIRRECDLRTLCWAKGVIGETGGSEALAV